MYPGSGGASARSADPADPADFTPRFSCSRFTRGWTLQELIAPPIVVFLSRDWEGLGTKDVLADVIKEITSIDPEILTHERALSDESVADRMRWAANRKTTQVEDEAYSLLGVFGITMPALYGEGCYAFRRLQEEILRRIPDQSLFAWGWDAVPFPSTPRTFEVNVDNSETFFAQSPSSFGGSSFRDRTIRATGDSVEFLELPAEEYIHTPYGIRTQFCLLPFEALNPEISFRTGWGCIGCKVPPLYLVILRSQHASDPRSLLARVGYLCRDEANVECLRVPRRFEARWEEGGLASIFTLSLDDLARIKLKARLQMKTVYLPHPQPSVVKRRPQLARDKDSLNLSLPMWARGALHIAGYTISDIQGPSEHDNHSFSFSLSHCASFNIHIHYRHFVIHHRYEYSPSIFSKYVHDIVTLEARAWIIESPSEDSSLPSGAIIRRSPPYASTTWIDEEPWATALTARTLTLIADSGDEVTLRLALDLVATSRYNIRIEVVPRPLRSIAVGASRLSRFRVRHAWESETIDYPQDVLPPDELLHTPFTLTLLGSVKRALEMKGYSAHLDQVNRFHPSLGSSYSYSLRLTLSSGADNDSAIVVKYFHTLKGTWWTAGTSESSKIKQLLVVARVTLESSISDDNSETTVQDGPHVVIWTNAEDGASLFGQSLLEKQVDLTTSSGDLFTLHLAFPYAWPRFDYYLYADIEPDPPYLLRARDLELSPCPDILSGDVPYTLDRAHESVCLTLPADVKRTLQEQGYQVRFESLSDEGGTSANDVRHVLTLFHIDDGVTIAIEYSHTLTTRYPEPNSNLSARKLLSNYPFLLAEPRADSGSQCQQQLTLQACVRTSQLPSHRIQDGALEPSRVVDQATITTATVEWDALRDNVWGTSQGLGWPWRLSRKVITFTLPTGRELVLRLAFALVWCSEYCLIVEINPQIPLLQSSPTDSKGDAPSVSNNELEVSTSNGHQSLPQSSGLSQSAEANEEPPLVDPGVAISEGSPVWSRERVEDAENSVLGERSVVGAVAKTQGDVGEDRDTSGGDGDVMRDKLTQTDSGQAQESRTDEMGDARDYPECLEQPVPSGSGEVIRIGTLVALSYAVFIGSCIVDKLYFEC